MPSSLPSVEDLADYLRVVETAVDDYDVLDGVRLYTQSLIRKVTGRTWTVASGSALPLRRGKAKPIAGKKK